MYYYYDAMDDGKQPNFPRWGEGPIANDCGEEAVRELDFEDIPKRRKNIEFTMKVLKGKDQKEITKIFLDKHGISIIDFDTYKKAMKRVDNSKHVVLVWALPIFIISIAFLFTLLAASIETDAAFPKIFNVEEPAFYARFVNMMYGIFLFCGSLFLVFWSSTKIAKSYNWSIF